MLIYEVTLQVEPTLAHRVEDYMRNQHIPAIFATGCFRRIRFDQASPARFRTCYEAESSGSLDRYLRDHAPAFRADFQNTFPVGVTVARETWTERQTWQ
jgi:hypothetical protein